MATNAADGAFTPVQLKNLVGERIGPWKQAELNVQVERRAVQQTTLVYGFRNGKEKATLTVSDLGTENSAPGPAHWTGPPPSTARAGPRCARSSGARRRPARSWCCWPTASWSRPPAMPT